MTSSEDPFAPNFFLRYKGKRYSAHWSVEDNVLTVTTPNNSIPTHIVSSEDEPDMIARQILREMVDGGTALPD